MDFREAAAKIEDLQRLVLSQKKQAEQNTLVYNIPLSKVFTDSFDIFQDFSCIKSGKVAVDFIFEIDNPEAQMCNVAIYIDGDEADCRETDTAAGKGQYSVSFALNIEAGSHNIMLKINYSGGASRVVKGVCIKLCGSIKSNGESSKILVCKEDTFTCAAYNDKNNVYYCVVENQNLQPARIFKLRGDYTFCQCKHGSGGAYDAVYFYTDEGKLFMLAIPCYSAFATYRILLDEGVTSVAAAAHLDEGCTLYYLKGGNVYMITVNKEGGLLVPSRRGTAASSVTAKKVTPVCDIEGGSAFVLTNKSGDNTFYLFSGSYSGGGDSVNAQITANIEEA